MVDLEPILRVQGPLQSTMCHTFTLIDNLESPIHLLVGERSKTTEETNSDIGRTHKMTLSEMVVVNNTVDAIVYFFV